MPGGKLICDCPIYRTINGELQRADDGSYIGVAYEKAAEAIKEIGDLRQAVKQKDAGLSNYSAECKRLLDVCEEAGDEIRKLKDNLRERETVWKDYSEQKLREAKLKDNLIEKKDKKIGELEEELKGFREKDKKHREVEEAMMDYESTRVR